MQIDLNYFTRKPTRRIIIDGKNISIQADLVEKKVFISEGNKKSTFSKLNLPRNFSYENQHQALLKKDFRVCCSYKEGKRLMLLIDKIRNFYK